MEDTADYLNAGRRFLTLTSKALKLRWTAAFKDWSKRQNTATARMVRDLESELGLRKQKLPWSTVRSEVAVLLEQDDREPANDPEERERWLEHVASLTTRPDKKRH